MPCHTPSASVSRRRQSIPPSRLPKIIALLDLSKSGERETHEFLLRACSGRWPRWRLLGMRRQDPMLYVVVEWLRIQTKDCYSLVELALDGRSIRWKDFPTDAAACAALAALDDKLPPPSSPAAPAHVEGGSP